MGGRGSSSSGSIKTVAYDKWGKMIDEDIIDKNGDKVGYIRDEYVYTSEPDIRPVTKKDVLSDIDGWRNDDGTYGDNDTSISLAYKDGTFVDVDNLDGKAYKKTGIVGASISTGDYEMVWGGEVNKKTGKIEPWQTWSEDGKSGATNSYSGWKTTGQYKVRRKVTFNNPNGKGGYKTKYETLRKSTVKPVGDKL